MPGTTIIVMGTNTIASNAPVSGWLILVSVAIPFVALFFGLYITRKLR